CDFDCVQEDVRLDDLENAGGEEGQESIEIPSITPYLIKYEQAHVLGTHTLQTIICVSVMVKLNKETDIAMNTRTKRFPICQSLPDGGELSIITN
ncbi:DNA-directed RNA polymerases I, II, and III subunit RPABC2, partial [Rattus rattus]|uniref:DNA-directed RNA polymerases I, II, and III subunit RPABC2 n=1 Tax=Rattus rattus TaxID=10117 RepID=UPI0013F31E8B